MAVYMLFDRFDIDVSRFERPLLSDTLKRQDVLFVIDPMFPFEEGEKGALVRWVRAGGVLVVSSSADRVITPYFRRGEWRDFDEEQWRRHLPHTQEETLDYGGLPLERDVLAVDLATDEAIDPDEPGLFDELERATPLFADDAGLRVAAYDMGNGRVIILADTSFLANAKIGEADNAILAANLAEYALAEAGGERVAFDEYHFGYGSRPTGWSILGAALWRTPLGWGVLCLIVAGVLFLVYKGRKFGTRYPPTRQRRRTKLEYVHSVGATYQAAGAHALSFHLIYGWFRREAASAVGLPASAPIEALAAAFARRATHNPHYYEEILTRCEEALDEDRLSSRRISALLERLAAIETEVFDGHRTGK
jgi:hypothetical protein